MVSLLRGPPSAELNREPCSALRVVSAFSAKPAMACGPGIGEINAQIDRLHRYRGIGTACGACGRAFLRNCSLLTHTPAANTFRQLTWQRAFTAGRDSLPLTSRHVAASNFLLVRNTSYLQKARGVCRLPGITTQGDYLLAFTPASHSLQFVSGVPGAIQRGAAPVRSNGLDSWTATVKASPAAVNAFARVCRRRGKRHNSPGKPAYPG